MSLREYERKRDFKKTAEPKPRAAKTRSKQLSYVIQKHDASRLHYDFRLELDGALKSWAVPKGVPFAKGDKRLAVHVEDHPLDYANFEGVIPAGQYGGGTVMVWDKGTWECLGGDPREDLASGKLHFALHGEKLDGEWTLVKIRSAEDNQWLLIKSGESTRPISSKRDDESILTQRTMRQIAGDRDAEWQSNRVEKAPRLAATLKARIAANAERAPSTKATAPPVPRNKKSATAARAPQFVEPMKAKLVDEPPRGSDWIYELKFDGFRALAIKDGKSVEVLSRNQKDLGRKFPEIVAGVRKIAADRAVIDGEIVALDSAGRSSFQLLQAFEMGEERPPICLYAFDLLRLEDDDLTALPLMERKQRLQELLQQPPEPLRFSASIEGDPQKLLSEVKARGLEGIIGKQRDSLYESGRRSGAWIKLKCLNEQEFVIGGFTPPQGTRKHFGAILVGYFEGETLKFAGKVGTGFNTKLLGAIHSRFEKLRRPTCPFANLPEKSGGRWSQNITPAEMRRCTWVEPELVAQVKFTEWTRDDKLRHPVFLGLRDDKPARHVVRERPS